jgi:parvulin-like peptidyl-prolyl isomerase
MRRPEKMHVSHICVTTEEEAKQVRAEILAGKDFAEVARQHSIDPWTKDRGGDYGWIGRGDDPFQKAAFELSQDGELSPPVETKMGWHIIRREEHRPASTPNFEEIRDELRERMLSQRRLQMMNQKRGEILQAAKIERNLEPADLVSTAEPD